MDENLVVLATWANNFSIYNILMIKTYVTSLELQYLFDNQFVSNFLLVFMYCLLTKTIQNIIFYPIHLSYDLFINIIYDDYSITYYTCKLNFIGKTATYYNHNQT
jgi:hypothetical protein